MLHQRGCGLMALACAWALSACAGDGPPPSPATSSFDSIQQTIFNVNCLLAGCHTTTDQAGNLVLVEGQSYQNLVNVVPSTSAAAAAGFRRVVPGNADRSFLLIKLVGGPTFDPRYGSPMPKIGGPLSATDIERIREWILAGAPPPDLSVATPSESPSPSPTATASPSPTIAAPEAPTSTATPTVPAQ